MKISERIIEMYEGKDGKDLVESLIQNLEASNNTRAWQDGDYVYVDSLKYPKVFIKLVSDEYGLESEIMHEEKKDKMIMYGEKGTNLKFGGKTTSCHVVRFKLPKWYLKG